jgi:hypothetical protein
MGDVDYVVNLILAKCDCFDENTLAEVEARLRVASIGRLIRKFLPVLE